MEVCPPDGRGGSGEAGERQWHSMGFNPGHRQHSAEYMLVDVEVGSETPVSSASRADGAAVDLEPPRI